MAFSFLNRKRSPARGPSPREGDHESRVRAIASDLLEAARGHERGFFSARFHADKLVNWAMKDPHFKTQLFRFVDVYPTLRTPQQVYDHVAEYLLRDDVKRPPGFDLGMKLGAVAKGAVAGTMSSQIRAMARQFIAGASVEEALPSLRDAWEKGIAFSVDLLGEVCLSDAEADVYLRRYLDVLDRLAVATREWPHRDVLESDLLGVVPRVNVSIKLSSLSARLNPLDPAGSIADLRTRVVPILERARDLGAFVNVDMEHSAWQPLTIEAFKAFAAAIDTPMGLAMQAYLASGDDDARDLAAWAKSIGRVVTVRLVKGAYWDHETILAEMNGWPPAVWGTKRQTDACFERMAGLFLESTPRRVGEGGVMLAVGSHNLRSVAAALAKAERLHGTTRGVELQMLYGMADPMKLAAAGRSLRIRNYVPLGEMIPGMAYLVRRLLENTSNESWLRAGFVEQADPATLFASPHDERSLDRPRYDRVRAAERHALSDAPASLGGERFISEPPRDFSLASERERFAASLRTLSAWDRSVPAIAVEAATDAVARADRSFASWRDRPAAERARLLLAAADAMRRDRDRLAGMIVVEAGKPWVEADAEACEAIDFCDYYARQSLSLFEPRRLGRFVGELDEVWCQPRGVAVVISPWNFPLAIACGMTVAALITGNPVLLKPAEQTPAIARELVRVLHEAGFPRDVLQLVPGEGETVGASLVRDPRVALIAFTGSRAVGFDILRAAGDTRDGQASVKKVIAEMGGKNAMIVDESADPDEAVLGVRQSAFGYAGQKCSAASRVVVVDGSDDGSLYARFVERLVASTRCLVVGDPRDPGTQVGPVIDADAKRKILGYVAIGKAEAKLALAMDVPEGLEARTGRAFVGPHVFVDVPSTARIWHEEIFGPVLAVTRARSFDEAIELANASPYKLTGGVYSRTPSHLERAKRSFRVGNLYLNRGITGAVVGRQPFGGFGHSGVGSKAGGGDYLLQFVEPRACCENTLRRGFAPEMG